MSDELNMDFEYLNLVFARFMGYDIKEEFYPKHLIWHPKQLLGYDISDSCRNFYDSIPNIESYHIGQGIQLDYTSWEWLMPVVQEIESLEVNGGWSRNPFTLRVEGNSAKIIIDAGHTDSFGIDDADDVESTIFFTFKTHNKSTKKEAVLECALEFIEWYNKYILKLDK